MNKDYEHLRWLAIGFYVNAAITALFSCIPFVHLFVGIAMLSGQFEAGSNPPPPFFGWMFVGFASIFILLGFTLAICNALAGKFLKRRQKYMFCFVLACVNCAFAPLGTILGVFAIVVLARDSVKALFDGGYNASQFDSSPNNPPNWQ